MVRVYDFETKTTVTIPASELAPGCVRATIDGLDIQLGKGDVYIDARQLEKRSANKFRHPAFTGAMKTAIEEIADSFGPHAHVVGFDDWEAGFRRDTNPASEVALWVCAARAFRQFSYLPSQHEVFKVVGISMSTPSKTLDFVLPKLSLSKNTVRTIANACWAEIATNRESVQASLSAE